MITSCVNRGVTNNLKDSDPYLDLLETLSPYSQQNKQTRQEANKQTQVNKQK